VNEGQAKQLFQALIKDGKVAMTPEGFWAEIRFMCTRPKMVSCR